MSARLITGAASGIGRAVAIAASERWADPLTLVDSDDEGLRDTIQAIGGRVDTLSCAGDLGGAEFPHGAVAATIEKFGGLSAVVSNAGIVGSRNLVELDVAAFDRELAVNFRATWLLAQAAFPYLKAECGALVATASIAATMPAPALGVYGPSKAALAALIKQLAIEWASEGIRCNSVSPGPIRTGITAAAYADPAALASREKAIPLGHVGAATDVAEAILFLLSDASRFVTGADIVVDGGFSLNLMQQARVATNLKADEGRLP